MVLVVELETDKVLARFEAWEENSIDNAIQWAEENGYKLVIDEITPMGNMVIYVR